MTKQDCQAALLYNNRIGKFWTLKLKEEAKYASSLLFVVDLVVIFVTNSKKRKK